VADSPAAILINDLSNVEQQLAALYHAHPELLADLGHELAAAQIVADAPELFPDGPTPDLVTALRRVRERLETL
jgi:hypothetical protein